MCGCGREREIHSGSGERSSSSMCRMGRERPCQNREETDPPLPFPLLSTSGRRRRRFSQNPMAKPRRERERGETKPSVFFLLLRFRVCLFEKLNSAKKGGERGLKRRRGRKRSSTSIEGRERLLFFILIRLLPFPSKTVSRSI